jgi:hypothetical protein
MRIPSRVCASPRAGTCCRFGFSHQYLPVEVSPKRPLMAPPRMRAPYLDAKSLWSLCRERYSRYARTHETALSGFSMVVSASFAVEGSPVFPVIG